MQNWKKVMIALLIGLIVMGGMYIYRMYTEYKDTLSAIQIMNNKTGDDQGQEKMNLEPFNMILYGLSERQHINDPGRPDTIMLALVEPSIPKLSLVSIPRDTYVNIPGQRMDKLNHAYSRGGADLLVKTVEEWLDIEIRGYTAINFEGFIGLVDLAGGIIVDVPRDMRYSDPIDGTNINLIKGIQKLDGKKTLDFVRFRKSNDGKHATDYERMERQQEILRILGNELVSLRSITSYFDIMNILKDNVRTTLTVDELDKILRTYFNFSMANLETTSVIGHGVLINGGWYEKVPQGELDRIKELINNFYQEKDQKTQDK